MRTVKLHPPEAVLEKLETVWALQAPGERPFFGVQTVRGRGLCFRWNNYIAGTAGILGTVAETQATETVLQVVARLQALREGVRIGTLLRERRKPPTAVPARKRKIA